MVKTVGEIVAAIALVTPFEKAAGWDPVGLQFGDPSKTVSTVGVCHEVTDAVADRLIAEQVDLVVAYHPLLFRPVTKLVPGTDAAGRAFRLISHGVALVTVHTAFDVAPGGTADALAESLGLRNVRGAGPEWGKESVKIVTFAPAEAAADVIEAMAAAGAGRIGAYSACSYRTGGVGTFLPAEGAQPAVGDVGILNQESEERIEMIAPESRVAAVVTSLVAAHPYEEPAYDVIATRSNAGFIGRVGELERSIDMSELAALVRAKLGGVVRFAGDGSVSTVAVIPGSGGSFIAGINADAVVTGDVSHHQARAAAVSGLGVVDPGHAATERPGVKALYAAVSAIHREVLDLAELDPDPWKEG